MPNFPQEGAPGVTSPSLRLDEQFRFDEKTPIFDNLNRLETAIESRLQPLEASKADYETAIASLTSTGLQRMNDVFTPLITEAMAQLANFGSAFSATSTSSVTIGLGTKIFTLSEVQREAFIASEYMTAHHVGGTESMTGTTSYNRDFGELTITVTDISGSGTFSNWQININAEPDRTHALRTDNPHNVTAAQVGAYTTSAADAAAALAIANAFATGPGAVLLHVDAAQGLSDPQKGQGRANLGLGTASTRNAGGGGADLVDNTALATALATSAFSTGDVKPTFKIVADPGWVILDDGSIGNATSGATTRANSDTLALFSLLYTNILRNGTATAATISNANPAIVGSTAHGLYINQKITFATTGTLPTPLTVGVAYFVSGTSFGANSFAVAAAPGGTPIATTTAGSGTHTYTATYALALLDGSGNPVARGATANDDFAASRRLILPRALGHALAVAGNGAGLMSRHLGETAGSDSISQNATQVGVHNHAPPAGQSGYITYVNGRIDLASLGATNSSITANAVSGDGGSGLPMDLTQTSLFMNVMVKL